MVGCGAADLVADVIASGTEDGPQLERAVHALQLELTSEWHSILVDGASAGGHAAMLDAAAGGGGGHPSPGGASAATAAEEDLFEAAAMAAAEGQERLAEPPLCSSPPRPWAAF